jgi:DNA-binding transcriptional MerR regulator
MDMAIPAGGDAQLVPIDEVARRLGLRASAIRYYEERGLVDPTSRHSGRRWYGPTEIRRLAIIQYWQTFGRMSLGEIGEILAGSAATRQWTHIVEHRIEALRVQAERMEAARRHLEHVLFHHPDSPPDGCSHYEGLISDPHTSGLLEQETRLDRQTASAELNTSACMSD